MNEEFKTGAVRDITDGKPRIDLFSPHTMFQIINSETAGRKSSTYLRWTAIKETGNPIDMVSLFYTASKDENISIYDTVIQVSHHLAEGAKKYSERNWEKGIPISRVIQSADRHLFYWIMEDPDDIEDHFAAFLCNLMFIHHYICEISAGKLDPSINDMGWKI